MKNICVLRLSAIGDVCHAVALVDRLQRQLPSVRITWIIGKLEYQLVALMPDVEFIIFDKKQGKAAYQQLAEQLRGRHFDALLQMQVAFRANWASRYVHADIKLGFDWQRSKELHWVFCNKRIRAQQHSHVLDGFMAFADALGLEDDGQRHWPIPVTDDEQHWAGEQARHLGRFVVICAAASKAERSWLPERYAAIADYLIQQGFSVVLCGGPAPLDRALAKQIQQHSAQIAADYVGKTSLRQLFALLGQAALVIAPDTGPAHMATAAGTPVIGLYAHSNPRRTGPYRDLTRVVSTYEQHIEAQQGKPWQQLPWGKRAKGTSLMNDISTEQVKKQVDRWLAGQ